jgi:serine/threonine protein kinase
MPRDDAPRDLLFGLLALQNGMVTRDQVVAAFAVWTAAGHRPMADLLVEQGALDPAGRDLLLALADRHLRVHGGDPEKSLAALDINRSIRASLARAGGTDVEQTLAVVGSVSAATEQDGDAERTTTYASSSHLGIDRRFRVLRPHARGGLGAVFVALDAELNREVALKQILESHAHDPRSRQRFLLEAEITGGLEHPGIVPVYGLGTDAEGRPYYAMRFIRGDSLKEAADRFHADKSLKRPSDAGRRTMELQKLLRRFLGVCDVIEYAHERGVLHRDIKPANVILGKHGETLVVDWGLAKLVSRPEVVSHSEERALAPPSSSGITETQAGAALGTPGYMSPEHAAGDLERLGVCSDVYSLGATLYYILAGRAPFTGDVGDVLRAVLRHEFPPPRSAAPWIDRALEAICLTAMAKQPNDRYPSARALATDIERWLADEHVAAYKEPLRQRLARWERRHKPLVYGTFTVLAITAAGLAVTASVVNQQRRISERAKELADQKAREADSSLELATQAVYDMLSYVGDGILSQAPGMTRPRNALAGMSIRYFENLTSARPNDPVLLLRAAGVFRNAAYGRAAVGDLEGAKRAFSDGLKLLDRRDKLLPDSAIDEERRPLAEELARYTGFLVDHAVTDMPLYNFAATRDRVRKMADEFLAKSPGTSLHNLWRYDLAGRLDLFDGLVALATGDLDRARAMYARAVERLDLAARAPGWYWGRLYLAQAHRGLAMVAHETGEEETADQEFAQALTIIRKVADEDSLKVDPKYVLGWTLEMNGRRLASIPGRGEKADAAIAESLAIADKLCADFPEETRYASLRGLALLDRGLRQTAVGRDERAEPDFEEADRIFTGLAFRERDDRNTPIRLARAETALARLRTRQGRTVEADTLLQRALRRLDTVLQERPQDVEAKRELRAAGAALGEMKGKAKGQQ